MAIEFGFEYRFANCNSTLTEFEIYNNFENCLAVGADTRNVFFFLNNFLINLFNGNLGNF